MDSLGDSTRVLAGGEAMGARAQVAGIGGVFFKARDPAALAAWYREHLGVPVAPDGTHAVFAADPAVTTVWSAFPGHIDRGVSDRRAQGQCLGNSRREPVSRGADSFQSPPATPDPEGDVRVP
jgi:hypothetical protein